MKTTVSFPIRIWRLFRIVIHTLRAVTYMSLRFDRLDIDSRARYVMKWSQRLLKIAGVNTTLMDTHRTLQTTTRAFLIANHISWLDIFVIYQNSFAYFVAKAEIRHWPLLGHLTSKSGAIFIDRAKRHSTAKVNFQINDALDSGSRIALFPEGTTSEGITVQTFHASLLQPAIDNKANVVPITLRYLDSQGKASHHACYTGDTSLLCSLWRLVSQRQTKTLMIVGKAITCENIDRKTLSRHAYTQIAQTLEVLNETR